VHVIAIGVHCSAMPTPEELRHAWEASLVTEREAWEKVKDKLPGSPKYDEGLWDKWRAAVKASDDARKAMIAGIDGKP